MKAQRGSEAGEPTRLVYYGESLGTAVCMQLAAQHLPDGMILQSGFASLADVGQAAYPFLPVKLLLKDKFDV